MKPDPALYRAVVDSLGVRPDDALALEDSPNGVLAAKRAGLACVAVPNALTARLDLGHADLVVGSLADVSLAALIQRLRGQSRTFRYSRAAMPVLAGQRIFTVAGTSYAWEDLVLAGCLWGDWPALEARVRDGLACLARLDELDEDAPLPPGYGPPRPAPAPPPPPSHASPRRTSRPPPPSSDTRGISWWPPTWTVEQLGDPGRVERGKRARRLPAPTSAPGRRHGDGSYPTAGRPTASRILASCSA